MNGNYKELLPEIAELLNTSVSELESRPEDMQCLLGQVYINNYYSDIFEIKQELGKVIELNSATQSEIQAYEQQKNVQKSPPEPRNVVQDSKNEFTKAVLEEKKMNIYFSREQRRKVAEQLQQHEKSEQQEQANDDMVLTKNGG
ncbi:MAG: hypothetical protein ACI4I6_03485 [Hominimerdicola sp.]